MIRYLEAWERWHDYDLYCVLAGQFWPLEAQEFRADSRPGKKLFLELDKPARKITKLWRTCWSSRKVFTTSKKLMFSEKGRHDPKRGQMSANEFSPVKIPTRKIDQLEHCGQEMSFSSTQKKQERGIFSLKEGKQYVDWSRCEYLEGGEGWGCQFQPHWVEKSLFQANRSDVLLYFVLSGRSRLRRLCATHELQAAGGLVILAPPCSRQREHANDDFPSLFVSPALRTASAGAA